MRLRLASFPPDREPLPGGIDPGPDTSHMPKLIFDTPPTITQITQCDRLGRHFFQRDHIFGVVPVGEPYCIWCGATLDKGAA
jgi:hypothetical protein